MTNKPNSVTVNGKDVPIQGERNLLELIRKTGIDIPTFCYHSELSIYGACRLCLVEVEGRGIMASCSTAPEAGMVIHTDTKQIRDMRKINVELLLANHNRECPSCSRSANCTLQDLARKLGVTDIRYKAPREVYPIDDSSPSLVRDPNKCVLCGDCVRVCSEVQTVGALDFINRGAHAKVAPAFGHNLADVECVNCGQCAAVCPTGAIVPKNNCDNVWDAIHDPEKTVVVQVAPAVRVALGDLFGLPTGENVARLMVRALKLMGFDQVYDTCFAADMTIFEEATEFLGRVGGEGKMPMFTSCCPGWVKFVETYYPEFLPNVSTTRSPQQIFGAVARKTLPAKLNVKPENLVVVSIMPCTAKKYEAQLDKFAVNGQPDVDYVLTTIELGQMIDSMGIKLADLEYDAFDMPLGFSTGGAVIFGTTGGVMEAALRYAVEKISGENLEKPDFLEVRGDIGRKEASYTVAGTTIRTAVVSGLGNARALLEDLKAGKVEYDFIEVMACPGGCIAGGGQPINSNKNFHEKRATGLYQIDKERQLQKPQDNYLVDRCYRESFGGGPGSHEAHHSIHTHYQNRSLIFDARSSISVGKEDHLLNVTISMSTKSDSTNDQNLLCEILNFIKENGYKEKINLEVAYSPKEKSSDNYWVMVGDRKLNEDLSFAAVAEEIKELIKKNLA